MRQPLNIFCTGDTAAEQVSAAVNAFFQLEGPI